MKHVKVKINRFVAPIYCILFGVLLVSPLLYEINALFGSGTSRWPLGYRMFMYAIIIPLYGWAFRAEWQKFIIRSLVVEERGLSWQGRVERLIPWSDVESVEERVAITDDRRIIVRVTDGRRIVIHDGISNYKDVRNAIRHYFPGECRLASEKSEEK